MANQADYPVATVCRMLGVSSSHKSYGRGPRILEDLPEEGERIKHQLINVGHVLVGMEAEDS